MLQKHGWTTYFSLVCLSIFFLYVYELLVLQCLHYPDIKKHGLQAAKLLLSLRQWSKETPSLQMTSLFSEMQ